MITQSFRVFTPDAVLRIGSQNNVLRQLRKMGCKVHAAALDRSLTITVDATAAPVLRKQKGGTLTKRLGSGGEIVSVYIDGCCVTWKE